MWCRTVTSPWGQLPLCGARMVSICFPSWWVSYVTELLSTAVTSKAGIGGLLTTVGTVLVLVTSGTALAKARREGGPSFGGLPSSPTVWPSLAPYSLCDRRPRYQNALSCSLVRAPFSGYVQDMKRGFQKVLFIRQRLST